MHCSSDIDRSECGRLVVKNAQSTQEQTLACLQQSQNLAKLSDECKKEIFHVSEMQGDNIKLDPVLAKSCSEDVKVFCSDFTGHDIYKCLMKNKKSPKMSKKCENQLNRRTSLLAQDYRISKGLAKNCKDDIKIHHCRKGTSDDKDIRLSKMLLVSKRLTRITQSSCRIVSTKSSSTAGC